MHKQKVVTVGGGISGLFSANQLAANDQFDISFIESKKPSGGLLDAYRSEQGILYDQGTHLALKTGIAHIVQILFGEGKLAKHWHEFSYLNSGNYFSEQWNFKTQVVEIISPPTECYQKCAGELLTSFSDTTTEDYSTFIRSHVESYLSDKLFTPSVKKLYGDEVDPTHLKPKVGYFGLNHVVAFGDETSEVLKSIPKYEEKLSFSSSKYFAKKMNITESYLYPKSELGIQFWTDSRLNNAANKGVKVKTYSQITHLNVQQANVMKVELKELGLMDNSHIVIDQARQTIPNTFPVPTNRVDNTVKEVGELSSFSLKNVIFAGRHSSITWLQTDVIESIDKQIEEIFF